MSIKATVKMNLSFPELNLQEQLEEIARKVIVPDIEGNMIQGTGIDGVPHKPNTEATKKAKSRKGLRTEPPLVASGQLLKSFQISLVGNNAVSIAPRGVRRPYSGNKATLMNNNDLADMLQNQGVGGSGHTYNFFGISIKAENEAMKFMFNYIKKAIADGKQRFVR